MATNIIPLITPSADRLCDIVSGQLQYVTRYEEYYSKLEKGMVKLQAKKEDVVRKLEKARRELKEPTKCVLEWLKSFETVEKEWMTLREKRYTSSRCMNGFLPNPLSRRKMSKQILKMTPYVNDIYRDGDFTEVADDPQLPDVVPQVTSGTVHSIESRERIMKDMMVYLEDDSIRSIGVHGMGGIGKTTLVKSINDKLLVKPYFKKVIMVTVSKDPNLKEIQRIIAERLGLELKEIDQATRANKLCERLKMEGSVLIILDDMWNTMELGELGLCPGTQDMNCKFIITTRNVNVCKQMKVQKKVKMGLLSETEDGTKTNAGFIEVATLPLLSILEVHTCEAEGSEGNPDWLNNVKQFHIALGNYAGEWQRNDGLVIENENMQKHLWVGKLFKNSKRNNSLVLWNCHGFKSVTELGADGGFNGLAKLQIMSCDDLEKVMVANESHDLFWTLGDLYLSSLKNLEKIFDGVTWPVKFLGQLRSICIKECPRLSIIFPGNILFPEKRLENLQTVTVRNCEAVQHVFSTNDDETVIVERPEIECDLKLLSGITNISLVGLPTLKSIWNGVVPPGNLQGLTKLKVSYCQSLQYLLSLDLAVSIHSIKEISVKFCVAMEKIIKPIQEERDASFFPWPPTPPIFESLHCLIIDSCPKLKFLFSFGDSPHKDVREKVALALGKIRPWPRSKDAIDDWVVPIIVKLLRSHQEDIRAQAVLALGNVVYASAKCRDLVLGYGGLTALLAQLNGDIEDYVIRNAALALCRLFYHKPYPPLEQMKLALPALKSLIHSNDETVCSKACEVISVIAADTTVGIQAVIEADVCPQLMELLQHPSPSVAIAALKTIKNIALGDDMQIQCIIGHQVLPCLLDLLIHDHKKKIKVAACWTIANIMHKSVEHRETVIGANIIGPLVHQLEIGGGEIKLAAITAIRNATRSPTEEVAKHLVDQGCLKPLCDHLGDSFSFIIKRCLEGLQNILQVQETSDKGDVNRYVQLAHDSGGLKKIVVLLRHSSTQIQDLAIGTIGIIVHLSPECKDLVLGLGALIPLLSHLNGHARVSILSSSLEALLNFFMFRPYPSFEQMKPALPDLQRLIHSNDETVCSKACLVLGGLCICTFDDIKDFFDPSIFSRLLELLEHPSPSVVWAAVIAIVSIARCGKVQSQCFIDHRALPLLLSLLTQHHEECIKRAACAAITNIMSAGEDPQVQAIIDATYIGPLVQQLESFESCKEYVPGAIFNATSTGNWEHIHYIANQDCIKLLCDLLDSPDSIIVAHCLNVLANIFWAGETGGIRDQGGVNSYAHLIVESGGLKKIVNLQHHSNTDIQEKAANIVKAYHLDTSPPSDTPVASSPKGLAEELEGGEGNKLGHDKAETQVDAPVVGSHVASGIATISSPLHGDTPLVEKFERVRGNKLGHENTESQEKAVSLVATSQLEADDASPTDSFGLGKNKFPILPERSDLATSSSFFSKPMQKHDLNSSVGKNDQSEGSASKQESSRAPSITETMKILDAMDIKIGDHTYFRTVKLFQDEGWREAFMCMSDARRKGWLMSIEAGEI